MLCFGTRGSKDIEDDGGLGARAGGCVQEIYMCGDCKCKLEYPRDGRQLGGRADDQGSL